MNEEPKKVTAEDLLKVFKGDLSSADTLRQEAVTARDVWKKQYNGDLYGNEEQGKSKIVSRDIKRQDEWQHASVKDPFVADQDIIKCNPVTAEDKQAAVQNELVLNYQFTRKFNRYKFMTDVVKLRYSEGTVIVKTGWSYEDEVVEEEVPVFRLNPITQEVEKTGVRLVKKLKVLVNQPDAVVCRLEDIYLDPTAEGDIDNAQFIIHRYETDVSSMIKSKKYKNIKKLLATIETDSSSPGSVDDYDPEDDTNFVFSDKARKKIILYEYWGNYDVEGNGVAKPIVFSWCNDIVVQWESNPLPDQKLPFVILANNSIPFKMYGEADAELIGDNQKITTAIKRGILDNMANSNNSQKGIKKGSLDVLNKKRYLNDKNFEYMGSHQDFYEGSYNTIPASVFNVLEMVNNETDSMLGVKGFAGGIEGGGLGSTARAASGVLDAVAVRRLDIVRNIAENMIKPIMRKWMAYNAEFLQPEEVIRITNEKFIPIKRDDLKGNIDINIEVSTAEDNAAKAEMLAFMLQTGAQTMDQGEVRLIRAEIHRLRKMPVLAKKIEEYQPQPDPFTEEMKQLEKQKIMAEIEERLSRARENEVDIRNKTAQAVLNEAKARHIGADADLKDLEFLRKSDGTEFDEKIAEKEFDRRTQADIKRMDKKLTEQ